MRIAVQNLPDSHTQIRSRPHSVIEAFKEIPKRTEEKKESSFIKSAAERQKYAGKLQKVVDK